MKNTFKLGLSLLACAAVLANAQGEGEIARYFDCWMENVGRVDQAELDRLGVKTFGEAWLCGCFNIEIQGDKRNVLKAELEKKGYIVKLSGG